MNTDLKKLPKLLSFPVKKNKHELLLKPIEELTREVKRLEIDNRRYELSRVHSRLAQLFSETGNWKKEQAHHCYAAKNMYKYYKEQMQLGWEIECYVSDDVAKSYRRAIEICLQHKMHSVAGMIMTEAAHNMRDMEKTEHSSNIFQEALNLQTCYITKTQTLYELISIAISLKAWGTILTHSDHIWMLAMRESENSEVNQDKIKDTEIISILLLNFDDSIEHSSRHRSLLTAFNLENPEEEMDFSDLTLSTLSEDERRKFRKLMLFMKTVDRGKAFHMIPTAPFSIFETTAESEKCVFYSVVSLNLCRAICFEIF